MKTKKEIESELKKYKILDDPQALGKSGLYQGPMPLSEWAMYQDIGYKLALEWVLKE